MAKSFVVPARALEVLSRNVGKALVEKMNADDRSSAAIGKAFNAFLDTLRSAGLPARDVAAARAVSRAIRDDLSMLSFVEAGALGGSTLKCYASGAARAAYHGVAWHSQAHADEALALPSLSGEKKQTKKAVATAVVKISKRDRTVLATPPAGVDLGDLAAVVAAIQAEPARMALALAWVKSHGWAK